VKKINSDDRKITRISSTKLICIFELAGCVKTKQTGSHIKMKRKGSRRPVIIQESNSVPVSHIKANMNTANLSREKYFEYLDKC